MNDYSNGFRHLTVFGETSEDKENLNKFLKDNNYKYDENQDGIKVAVKEAVALNDESNADRLKIFMTRLTEEEAKAYEESLICNIADSVADNFINNVTEDLINNLEKDLEGNEYEGNK